MISGIVLAAVACDASPPAPSGGATPAPVASTAPVTPTLAGGDAAEAEIGLLGGALEATDTATGTLYRLTVPSGALADRTMLRMTPITNLGGLPETAAFTGGVAFEPDGLVFGIPARLEILPGPTTKASVANALASGQGVFGLHYEGDGANIRSTFADVDADGSRIALDVWHFSGAGAGYGPLSNPSEPRLSGTNGISPDVAADCGQIAVAMMTYEAGGTIVGYTNSADALHAWADAFLAENERLLANDTSVGFHEFTRIFRCASLWAEFAKRWGDQITKLWYASGDPLEADGRNIETGVHAAYLQAVHTANNECKHSGDNADLVRLIGFAQEQPELFPLLGLVSDLTPEGFCEAFTVTPTAPATMTSGASAPVSAQVTATPPLSPDQLAILRPSGAITSPDAAAAAVGPTTATGSNTYQTTVTAGGGAATQARLDFNLRILDLTASYASAGITIGITPLIVPCADSPKTIRNTTDDIESIQIVFNAETRTCKLESKRGDPSKWVMLSIDSDPEDSRWEGEGGSAWGGMFVPKSRGGDYEYRFPLNGIPGVISVWTLSFTVTLQVNPNGSVDLTVDNAKVKLTVEG